MDEYVANPVLTTQVVDEYQPNSMSGATRILEVNRVPNLIDQVLNIAAYPSLHDYVAPQEQVESQYAPVHHVNYNNSLWYNPQEINYTNSILEASSK